MSKSNKAQRVQTRAINAFSVLEWRSELNEAASDLMSASTRVLNLMLKARNVVEPDTAREAVKDAFGAAYAELQGCSYEEALKAKSVKNRVADAMAVFGAKILPSALPKNLQHAATECRKANRVEGTPANDAKGAGGEGAEGGEGADGGQSTGSTGGEVNPIANALDAMHASLNVLRRGEHGEGVLLMIANLEDLIEDLTSALIEETAEPSGLLNDDVPEDEEANA